MIRLFRHAPLKPTLVSATEINTLYRYWRRHIMLTMYLGYAIFYFTRKNFNYALPNLMADLNLDKSDIGLMTTAFYVVYGLSKFFSGILSDHANPRYFMGVGLMLTGLINLGLGFSSGFYTLLVLWGINAWFQGCGWPPCATLLTSWYSRAERGIWWSIWNTAHNAGGALIPLLVGFLVIHYGWRSAFFVPGCLAIFFGLIVCWRLRDRPETLGLPSVGLWRNDVLQQMHEKEGRGLGYRQALKQYVLANKYIWLLGCSYSLVYMVRSAINDWGNLYLTEQYHYNLLTANGIVSLFEVGGFIGSLVAGWGSDALFKGNRGPISLIFSIGIFFAVAALWLMPITSTVLHAVSFFCIGFAVFGPQMLIGMAAAECSHKLTPGAATGFIGLFAYSGAALSGYPIALILERYAWNGFFSVIAGAAAIIALLFLPFLQKQSAWQQQTTDMFNE